MKVHPIPFFDNEECCICMDDLNNEEIRILSCRHRFHKKCFMEWYETDKTCPLCRNDITMNGPERQIIEKSLYIEDERHEEVTCRIYTCMTLSICSGITLCIVLPMPSCIINSLLCACNIYLYNREKKKHRNIVKYHQQQIINL